MQIDILTLFPEMFKGPMNESIMWRAQDKKFLNLNIINLRDFGLTKRLTVDDRPYGGGAGMILRVDVIDECLKSINAKPNTDGEKIILTEAGGQKFNQEKAYAYSNLKRIVIICGHYEGVDHRVNEHLIDESVSIGDYVLTGGEIPAMVIADAVTRLIPDVIKPKSLEEESFTLPTVEYPQYTRPEEYSEWQVPQVLLSGNHAEIEKWRKKK
ncbi:MAG: tRNA (guanosine(37)-N1)-methyltransferase TrmD [Janthinobacterium sp.]|jgi:tRNA (guanine37-N1)-methyltransferase